MSKGAEEKSKNNCCKLYLQFNLRCYLNVNNLEEPPRGLFWYCIWHASLTLQPIFDKRVNFDFLQPKSLVSRVSQPFKTALQYD